MTRPDLRPQHVIDAEVHRRTERGLLILAAVAMLAALIFTAPDWLGSTPGVAQNERMMR